MPHVADGSKAPLGMKFARRRERKLCKARDTLLGVAQSGTNQQLAQHESSAGPVVLQVRGALIASSLQTLRELSLFERYLQGLPSDQRDPILFALASSWLPVELALAHYGACEAMELPEPDLIKIGEHVAGRIMGTFLGTLLRSSRQMGASASPLIPLRQYHRLWDRLLVGGACTVRTSGLKDVTIESRGVPMFRYRYFRVAYTGLIKGAGLLFARNVFTRVRHASDTGLTIDASWV